jgi:PAS domain S-box-containing protein
LEEFLLKTLSSKTDTVNADLSTWTDTFCSDESNIDQVFCQSEERLSLVQRAGHIGIFEWNLLNNFEYWTPELCDLYGVHNKIEARKHADWTKLVHPEDLQLLEDFFQSWFQSGRAEESWEYRFVRQDTGETRWMAACGQLIRDKNGKAIWVVGTNTDVTEYKKLQEKLEDCAKNLEETIRERNARLNEAERLAAIGATAGMVGHDIRNPLQTVIGQLYLANCEIKSLPPSEAKENLKEICDIMEAQTIYVNKIVSDLQDYARQLKPIIDHVDMQMTIRNALANAHVQRTIRVERELDENLAIRTDKLYIQRILTNLITNAAQAMPMGGKLTITATKDETNAVLTVQDNGAGIPPEAQGKLFQPLFTTKSKGQGFGLAVVKRLTEALDGTVTFETAPNKGTKFIVTLPQ